MINPFTELRAFLRAALIEPVGEPSVEPASLVRRRRWVTAVTLVVGAATLGWALRLAPGDPLFYLGTVGLAVVWTVGALASGPLHLGRAHTHSGKRQSRSVVQALALGLLLLGVFLAGATVVAGFPALRDPSSTFWITLGSALGPWSLRSRPSTESRRNSTSAAHSSRLCRESTRSPAAQRSMR